MALLDIKTRQLYLKELGLYNDKIDGIAGKNTKDAYRKLQNKYFTRKADKDGLYGPNTDILLRNAYNCKDLKHFKLEEFKCGCKCKYCTGYPAILDTKLLEYIDKMRSHFGKGMKITSGLRCAAYNSKVGGSSTSRHKSGKAVDFYMTSQSTTFNGRKELVDYWIKNYDNSRYAYCNGYGRTKSGTSTPKSSTMGNAIHVDVK